MKKINVIVVKKSNDIISSNSITIRPTTISPTGKLDSLLDVDASGEITGAVPVYNAATDNYVIQQLNLADVVGDLDGGTF